LEPEEEEEEVREEEAREEEEEKEEEEEGWRLHLLREGRRGIHPLPRPI